MARGDYIDVTYRTGVGIVTHRVQAKTAGATVVVTGIDGRADFIKVEALDAGAKPKATETASFAKSEVVAVTEGSSPVAGAQPRKRAPK